MNPLAAKENGQTQAQSPRSKDPTQPSKERMLGFVGSPKKPQTSGARKNMCGRLQIPA